MKKCLKIVSIIIVAILIIFNAWALIVNTVFSMPSEMKKESVCFLSPGLTWNSTISDVNDCFGESAEKGKYNDVTGNIRNTYKTQYENRPMTVYATGKAFTITEMFCKRRVHAYSFLIDCSDEEDEKAVFEKLNNELINYKSDNKRFRYEKENDNEFSAYVDYGPCSISYNIEYDIYDDKNEVSFYADAQY